MLDSVVHHFAGAQYLLSVIESLIALLAAGGMLIMADVRHLGTVEASADLSLNPEFFAALPSILDSISAAEVRLKRGRIRDEATCHRYDVTLHTAPPTIDLTTIPEVTWDRRLNAAAVSTLLGEERPRALRIRHIANARLEPSDKAVEPEDLSVAGESLGYWVALTPALSHPTRMDAVFVSHDGKVLVPQHLSGCLTLSRADLTRHASRW